MNDIEEKKDKAVACGFYLRGAICNLPGGDFAIYRCGENLMTEKSPIAWEG